MQPLNQGVGTHKILVHSTNNHVAGSIPAPTANNNNNEEKASRSREGKSEQCECKLIIKWTNLQTQVRPE